MTTTSNTTSLSIVPPPIDLTNLSPETLAMLAQLRGEVPKTEKPAEVEKPFKYGLTPERRRRLARMRQQFPYLAREIHVWLTVDSAPYTTVRSLADECAAGSDLSVRTWQRVAGDMLRRGELVMGRDGYKPGKALDATVRPQASRTATRRLASRVGDQAGSRDPSVRAERVHRVLRHGQRKGRYYSSVLSLAIACARNGSGTDAGYRRVIERMLATAELTRDFTGAIRKADGI